MFRRTIIISSLLLAMAGTAVLAQGRRGRAAGRGGFPAQRIERLQQRLNLTDSQMNGIRALAENRRKEMEGRQAQSASPVIRRWPGVRIPSGIGDHRLRLYTRAAAWLTIRTLWPAQTHAGQRITFDSPDYCPVLARETESTNFLAGSGISTSPFSTSSCTWIVRS